MLVDLGGPGIPVLSGKYQLSNIPKALGLSESEYDFLFLEEPWVSTEVEESCSIAMSKFYKNVRESHFRVADYAQSLSSSCDISSGKWGHDPNVYNRVVESIAQKHGSDVVGFVGVSFGSVRWTYLKSLELQWSIFVRPFPLGADLAMINSERGEDAQRFYERKRKFDAEKEGSDEAFDLYSAMLRFGYLDQEGRGELLEWMDSGSEDEIRRAANNSWNAYSDVDLDPSYLAYLEEICRYQDVSPAGEQGVSSPEDILGLMHMPCAGVSGNNILERVEPHRENSESCVVISSDDIVSSADLVLEYFVPELRSGGVHVVESNEMSHMSWDRVDACADLGLKNN